MQSQNEFNPAPMGAGAGLSDSYLYWSKFLTSIFLMLLYLGWTTNQNSIPFGYLLHLLVEGHQFPVLFLLESRHLLPGMLNDQKNCGSLVFVTEEFDGAGSMGPGSTELVDVETNLKAFLEDFHTWYSCPQLPNYQHFWSISIGFFFVEFIRHPVVVRHIKYW